MDTRLNDLKFQFKFRVSCPELNMANFLVFFFFFFLLNKLAYFNRHVCKGIKILFAIGLTK